MQPDLQCTSTSTSYSAVTYSGFYLWIFFNKHKTFTTWKKVCAKKSFLAKNAFRDMRKHISILARVSIKGFSIIWMTIVPHLYVVKPCYFVVLVESSLKKQVIVLPLNANLDATVAWIRVQKLTQTLSHLQVKCAFQIQALNFFSDQNNYIFGRHWSFHHYPRVRIILRVIVSESRN